MIEFKHLSKRFSSASGMIDALQDVNLSIADGDIFGVIGFSGAGKSTLLRMVNRLEDPTEGEVLINGVNILAQSHDELRRMRKKIGMVFQQFNLLESRTVYENVALPLILNKTDAVQMERTVTTLLQFVGLSDKKDAYPSQLSGGQKQRVAMVRMIASEPDILLLDEPFSALDSYLKWELEQEMRDMLAEVQKPVLFVSHNRDEVYRLCSMVSCIDHGKMEVIEKTKEFFHNPKTKTAAVLSGCKNISAAEIVDNNHIKALGWGITLCVSEIPEETKAVGIRAHSFYPVNAEQIPGKESAANESRVSVIQEGTGLKKYRNPVQEENIFKIEESRIIEDPFEWNISFRPSKESGWLQWKIAKTEQEDSPGPIPPALAVHAKDILLLKDNAYE